MYTKNERLVLRVLLKLRTMKFCKIFLITEFTKKKIKRNTLTNKVYNLLN